MNDKDKAEAVELVAAAVAGGRWLEAGKLLAFCDWGGEAFKRLSREQKEKIAWAIAGGQDDPGVKDFRTGLWEVVADLLDVGMSDPVRRDVRELRRLRTWGVCATRASMYQATAPIEKRLRQTAERLRIFAGRRQPLTNVGLRCMAMAGAIEAEVEYWRAESAPL